MLNLIGRRVMLSVPLLLIASLVTFLLEYLVPGDAAAVVLAGSNATQADLEAMRHRLGLDRPLWQQYADWLAQAMHGDLGRSLATNQAVTEQLNGRLGVTLSLMVGVLIVCGTLGILLGTVSALRGGALGRMIDVLHLDLGATSNVFQPGHCIRLEIASSNFPRFDRNTQTGGTIATEQLDDAVPALNRVYHSPKYASRLRLPIIERSL